MDGRSDARRVGRNAWRLVLTAASTLCFLVLAPAIDPNPGVPAVWAGAATPIALAPEPAVEPTATAMAQPTATPEPSPTPPAISPTATPTSDPTATTTATATATSVPEPATAAEANPVNETVALRVERAAAGFGLVSGTGEVDAAVTGVTSIADDAGAYYLREDALRVTVSSDGAWAGQCHADENQGSATTVLVGDGRLSWRETGTSDWTPFTTDPSSRCFPAPRSGTVAYSFDLRLRVERTDPPGTFVSAITFSVSPERQSS